jgi:hypothetical protein
MAYYIFRKRQPLFPALSQEHPAHIFPPSVILLATPGLQSCPLQSGLHTQTPYSFIFSPTSATWPNHIRDWITIIIFGK